ncbi:MAG: ABC transporter permease subunit [Oscillospiraceae bacterium]|nr:ABC transporter permease subunit [Oscillospiraceae bacterium]
MQKLKKLEKIVAVAAALAVWQAAAMLLGHDLLLVSPVKVILRLGTIWREPGFLPAIGFTFWRIVAGFFSGFLAGTLLAVLAGRFHIVEVLLWPYMVTIKSVPVASFIIVCLIFFSSSTLSIFISFLMVLPLIYQNVLQGIKSADRQMLEMAKVFRVPWHRKLFYIDLPSLKPFLLSACSVALGLSWKSGVAAEVIGVPDGSIGEMLYQSKIYLDTDDLFAWTVIIILASFLFEKLFLWLLRRIFAWMEGR